MEDMNLLYESIVAGKMEAAQQLVTEAVGEGHDPQELIDGYMIKGMEEIGRRFQEGTAFVPNLLMAARAMKGAMDILKPHLSGNSGNKIGKIVIGTVKGDLHDIGKNLVASMFEGCGFEVINLGIDVSKDKFSEAVTEHEPQILCLSALLTTTMNYMKDVIDYLNDKGLRSRVKVMVGGAPLSASFADKIGADCYTSNANAAVLEAKRLLGYS